MPGRGDEIITFCYKTVGVNLLENLCYSTQFLVSKWGWMKSCIAKLYHINSKWKWGYVCKVQAFKTTCLYLVPLIPLFTCLIKVKHRQIQLKHIKQQIKYNSTLVQNYCIMEEIQKIKEWRLLTCQGKVLDLHKPTA